MAWTLNNIETPTLVIDETVALGNVTKFQAHCDARGLKLRPHIKTHKTLHFAKAQLEAGGVGINCQKIGEAEVMVRGGFDDILITFNVIGTENRPSSRSGPAGRRADGGGRQSRWRRPLTLTPAYFSRGS